MQKSFNVKTTKSGFHSACLNIGPKTYRDLGRDSVVWLCNTCGLPNVATSTFIDLDSYHTTNPFDELSNLSIECTRIGENAFTSTPLRNTNSRNKSTNLNLTDNFKNGSVSSHENSVMSDSESSLQSSQCVSSDKSTTSSSGSSSMVCRGDTLHFVS